MQKETKENYLKAIIGLTGKKGKIRNVDLAAALSITKPTVTNALHQLEDDGCIIFDRQCGIMLTDLGRSIALATLERHNTFMTILTCLGVDSETADRDACALEHCVSDESYDAFVRLRDMVAANRPEDAASS